MNFIASCFGYILNFIYSFVNNYGLAVILFSILVKIALLPISIKQQKTMEKSSKMQGKVQELQRKYKNNPEKLNQEIYDLYKNEKVNPFGGCLSSIIQLCLLLAVFYLIKSPLTFMKKVEPQIISTYAQEIREKSENKKDVYPEITIIKEKGKDDEKVNLNMNFLGIDLTNIPGTNNKDLTVYIIPALYVITTFILTRITASMQKKDNKNQKLIEGNVEKEETEETSSKTQEVQEASSEDAIMEANKMMTWMMPIMSISIAIIAPLGLSLYWLVSNILMILERIILNKISKSKEDEENA